MKKTSVYIGSIIILIISIITFVFMGSAGIFESLAGNPNKLPAFGKYNGKKIEYAAGTEFAQAASNIAQTYKNQGYEINTQMEYYIFNQAFEQTIMNMAFTDAVEKSGYKVPAEAVNREMLPYFFDETGKYSPRVFNSTDDARKNEIQKSIKESLVYTRYTDDLLGNLTKFGSYSLYGLKQSSKEDEFFKNIGNDKHTFNLASFSTSDFPVEEAVKFAKAKSELFVKYDISAISLEEEKDAKDLLAKLKANEITFEAAVSEKSQKYYSDAEGKLASPYQYQIVNMLEKEEDVPVVTGLAKDELSDVITTKRGYTIFRGNGPALSADFENEDFKNTALAYVKSNETGYIENYYTDIAKDFASQAAVNGFDAACEKFGITKQAVPAFPLNYGDSSLFDKVPSSSVSDLANASTNKNFLKKAFALKGNEISEPVVLGGKIVVLQLTGTQHDAPAEEKDLAAEIDSINQSSAISTLMASDKVENDFTTVFFSNFMNY